MEARSRLRYGGLKGWYEITRHFDFGSQFDTWAATRSCTVEFGEFVAASSSGTGRIEMLNLSHLLKWKFAILFSLLTIAVRADADESGRRPANDADLRFWLENMLIQHGYSVSEVTAATGLSAAEVDAAVKRLAINLKKPSRGKDDPLLVLPYPGGRHPRIGFLDGAVDPQRETKVSVFAPWSDGGYAVADIPEAIWNQPESGRELMYLAHTHVPTMWTKRGVTLERLEWQRAGTGWQVERMLPNKVAFGTRVTPARDQVRMEMWLANGSDEPLRGLVVQNCVMLKGLVGFEHQTNDNKMFQRPYVACHNAERTKWIITAWEPCQRPWGNAPCPCLHSDPKFPDCEAGKTVRIRGSLSFYEGADIQGELGRIDKGGWREG